MPITSSAKKALRSSKRKRVFNKRKKEGFSSLIKDIRKLVTEKKPTDAKALLSQAYKAIDKAAKTHVITKNNAARKKSRLAQSIKKAS